MNMNKWRNSNASCRDSCPKIKRKSGSGLGLESQTEPYDSSSQTGRTQDPNGSPKSSKKSVTSNRRSPTQSQKSVQIGGITAVESADSSITKGNKKSTNFTPRNDQQSKIKESPKSPSAHSKNHSKMSDRVSPRSSERGQEKEWDSARHNPCAHTCPMAKARDRRTRKAELRQERLDDYLLNKGFSYFDDLCTCSLNCLMHQMRKDKFVLDFLKSACLFSLGIKLCEELDAWNIIG